VAERNRGDETKKRTYDYIGPYCVKTALKNAAVAKSCLSEGFIAVKSFHQVHDGK